MSGEASQARVLRPASRAGQRWHGRRPSATWWLQLPGSGLLWPRKPHAKHSGASGRWSVLPRRAGCPPTRRSPHPAGSPARPPSPRPGSWPAGAGHVPSCSLRRRRGSSARRAAQRRLRSLARGHPHPAESRVQDRRPVSCRTVAPRYLPRSTSLRSGPIAEEPGTARAAGRGIGGTPPVSRRTRTRRKHAVRLPLIPRAHPARRCARFRRLPGEHARRLRNPTSPRSAASRVRIQRRMTRCIPRGSVAISPGSDSQAPSAKRPDDGRGEGFCHRFDRIRFGREHVRHACQREPDGRVVGSHERQELGTDPVAQDGGIVVGGIVKGRESLLPAPGRRGGTGTPSSGRTTRIPASAACPVMRSRVVSRRIPRRPPVPAPRSRCSMTVSAWSSCV